MNDFNVPKYISGLDGIRAIAVMLVIVAHAGFGNIIPGGLGVTIFFFLSGYLITTLLLKEYKTSGYIDVKKFYIRRFFRLFPPLFIVLTIAYLLAALGVIEGGYGVKYYLLQLFYLANFVKIYFSEALVPSGSGVLWSLAIEEHYYIFFPFVLHFLLRNFSQQRVAFFLIFLTFAILIWRLVLVLYFDSNAVNHNRTYYGTDTRLDSILYGSILALSANPFQSAKEQLSLHRNIYWYFLIGVAGLLFSLAYRDEIFRETFRYSMQGLALMPLFYFVIDRRMSLVNSILDSTIFKKIGLYSYTMYLVHFIAQRGLEFHFPESSRLTLFFFVMLISLVSAYLIDRFVDEYFRVLRAKYRNH